MSILIRAIAPSIGVEEILKRRNKAKLDKTVAGGPGTVAQALGINLAHNGVSLKGPTIWIEDRTIIVLPQKPLSAAHALVLTTLAKMLYAPGDFNLNLMV